MVKQPNIISCLEAGLRATSLRQKVLANNLANSTTPGYRRYDVQFAEQLAKAIESGDPADLDKFEPLITQPMNTPIGPNGNDVSFETEFGESMKNDGTYKTYIRLLAKTYRQMEIAIGTK